MMKKTLATALAVGLGAGAAQAANRQGHDVLGHPRRGLLSRKCRGRRMTLVQKLDDLSPVVVVGRVLGQCQPVARTLEVDLEEPHRLGDRLLQAWRNPDPLNIVWFVLAILVWLSLAIGLQRLVARIKKD